MRALKADNKDNQKTLRSAYWSALFMGAEKLDLTDTELSNIARLNYKTLNGWHNNKAHELPFCDLTRSDGILVKQFIDLYVNLRSMYIDPGSPAKWLKAINPSLKNKTPIEFMATEENGIFLVNTYLKSLASS
jgi:hypothetical protein